MASRYDNDKTRFELIPVTALCEAADVFAFGAKKYGEGNWQKGMKWTRMLASLERHLHAIKCGEDIDQESGLKHIGHLLCNAMMLADYYHTNVKYDDRYIPMKIVYVDKDSDITKYDSEKHKLYTNCIQDFQYIHANYPNFNVYLVSNETIDTIKPTQIIKE